MELIFIAILRREKEDPRCWSIVTALAFSQHLEQWWLSCNTEEGWKKAVNKISLTPQQRSTKYFKEQPLAKTTSLMQTSNEWSFCLFYNLLNLLNRKFKHWVGVLNKQNRLNKVAEVTGLLSRVNNFWNCIFWSQRNICVKIQFCATVTSLSINSFCRDHTCTSLFKSPATNN